MRLDQLPARTNAGAFRVVIECPRGASVKFKYDPELGAFRYSRPLLLGVNYPFDWGFVPGTRAPDGDPLDAMVLGEGAMALGVVVECRALGLLRITQRDPGGGGRVANDRVIAVPVVSPRWDGVAGVPDRIRVELEVFFRSVTALEGKEVQGEGFGGALEAEQCVDRAVCSRS